MNTTTRCQHALVFGTLSLLLVILACVAFLAPVTDYSANVVEPVTQVVTNPTSATDRRRGGTTNRYGYGENDDDDYYTQRGETRSTRTTRYSDRVTASTARHGAGATSRPGEATVGPNADPNVRSDTPVASLYPASGNRRSKRATNSNRNGDSNSNSYGNGNSNSYGNGNSNSNGYGNNNNNGNNNDGTKRDSRRMRDEAVGYMNMTRNESLPRGQQMQMAGLVGGLVPGRDPQFLRNGEVKEKGETYAISMHQHGDLQNGCSKLGPALNDGRGMNQRYKRASTNYGLSREEQREIRDWKEDHNGSLIGFVQANETGYGNFSYPVPLAYQDICDCNGAMGRAVNMRPVTGFPRDAMGGASAGKMGGGRPPKSRGDDSAAEFMNMIRGKREVNNRQGEYRHKDRKDGNWRGDHDDRRMDGFNGGRDDRRMDGFNGGRDDKRMGGSKGGRDDRRMDGFNGGRDDRRMDGFSGGRDDKRMGGSKGGRDDRRMDGFNGGRDDRRMDGFNGGRDDKRMGGSKGGRDDRRMDGFNGGRDDRRMDGWNRDGNEYHHKRPYTKDEMNGQFFMDGDMWGRMDEMNRMAFDGRLDGRNMHEHMGPPTACGVFGRDCRKKDI